VGSSSPFVRDETGNVFGDFFVNQNPEWARISETRSKSFVREIRGITLCSSRLYENQLLEFIDCMYTFQVDSLVLKLRRRQGERMRLQVGRLLAR
jgi:hypothetical protein